MCGFSCKNGLLEGNGRAEKLIGRAAVSLAGHDTGKIYFVTGVRNAGQRDEMLLLADGKTRKASSPKAKKLMHVRVLSQRSAEIAEAAGSGKPVDDSVIIHALRKLKAELGAERPAKDREEKEE